MRIACLQTPAFGLDEASPAATYLLRTVAEVAAAANQPDLILLPEMAYPAYYLPGVATAADLDNRLESQGAPTTAAFAVELHRLAARHGVFIAAGVALGEADGRLRNALMLCDRQGNELARVGKQFLWHFDACWFAPGTPPPVVDIGGVPTGLFICCDGRAPEIPRRLATGGARLFLDATNWVTSGRDARNLPNAQPDYMMRVRALENNCWFAAANKVGREADTIVYCGKSCVIAPDGSMVAIAPSDSPHVLFAEIDLTVDARGEATAMPARRSGEYRRLSGRPGVPGVTPVPGAPAATGRAQAGMQAAPAPYVAVAQVPEADGDLATLLRDLAIHGADVVVFPEGNGALAEWQALSAGCELLIIATGRAGAQRVAWLLHQGRILGSYAQGHLDAADVAAGFVSGPAEPPVFDTTWGRIGVMIGPDGLLPEVPRGLALAGADLIAWPHRMTAPWMEPFIRTRAAENRVFVAAAAPAIPGGEAMIADPGGIPLTRTFPGARQAVAAYACLSLARFKAIVPGTAVFDVPAYPELG